MTGWIMRFLYDCLHKEKWRGLLTCKEVTRAEKALLLCIQEHFEGKDVKVVNKMQTFKDQHGLMRVGTKLVLSDEDEEFKCPVLLPNDNPIVHRMD